MQPEQIDVLDWSKQGGLLPAIVQDADTLRVLMLGYMDRVALDTTLSSGKVTFFSRSRQRLWTKGEESGHFLQLVSVEGDCDNDTLLVLAHPQGPTCHLQRASCFADAPGNFLAELSPRRYFCLQCHVPQANLNPLVGNDFKDVDTMLNQAPPGAAPAPARKK